MPHESAPIPSATGAAPAPERLRVAFVGTSDLVDKEARDAAESELEASKEELSGVSGFVKRIWKFNLAAEYYRQKEIATARKHIEETGNIYAGARGTVEDSAEAKAAVVERFTSEFDETIHGEHGEKRERLDDRKPEEAAVKKDIREAIAAYARGEMDEKAFQEEENRIFSALKGVRAEVIGTETAHASNLLEIARQVKLKAEHDKGCAALDTDFDLVVGRAKSGVKTETRFNAVDRIVAKIKNSRVGSFVNETTIAAAVSAVYCVAVKVSERIARSKVAAIGSFGASAALAGGIAAMTESKRLEEERSKHARDRAKGKHIGKEDERRQELEQSNYEMRDATHLADELERELYRYTPEGKRELVEIDDEKLAAALGSLAEIESRIRLSDRRHIDLVSYSNATRVEQEQLRLDLVRARAKVDLRRIATERKPALFGGKSFDEYLAMLTDARMGTLVGGESGTERRDELFKKMKRRRVWKAGLKGVATGVAIGTAAQELCAFLDTGKTGLAERAWDAMRGNTVPGAAPLSRVTALEWLYRFARSEQPDFIAGPSRTLTVGGGNFTLPLGTDLVASGSGSYDILRNGDVVCPGLTFNPDGTLTPAAETLLVENGIMQASQTVTVGAKDFVAANEDLFAKVKRVLWYDNDTPKPVFDKNELKLHWGGEKGAGIDAQGNYVFNIKQMLPGGSYHGVESVDAQKAFQSGKLKLLLSLSRDTQATPVEVAIDARGNAVIDPESAIGKLLFSQDASGKAVFNGKFAEVAESVGGSDGAERVRILATHIGKGIESTTGTITDLRIPTEYAPEAPPVVPIFGRRPLEKTKGEREYIEGYYGRSDPEEGKRYQERQSPSLKDREAKLDERKEIGLYLARQDKVRLKETEELAAQITEPMDPLCRMAFCIPAAGHQEGKNIYDTLEWYRNQEDKKGNPVDPRTFEVVVFVNHPDNVAPDETKDEVEQFRKEHSEMRVRLMHKALPREQAKIGNIRKYLTDAMPNRQMARPTSEPELVLVSNDADCRGMSPTYVQDMQDEFRKGDRIEGVLGKIDWEPKAYAAIPALHIGTRLFQYLDIISRHPRDKKQRNIGSSGANFAYKASTYAAVGGYPEGYMEAEDVALGQAIKYARRGATEYPLRYGGGDSMVYTNARRGLAALEEGLSPAEQWHGDFGPNDKLRTREWNLEGGNVAALLDDPKYREQVKQDVEIIINRTLNLYSSPPSGWEAHKAIGFLGVKYVVVDGKVHITDASKMFEYLKRYQQEWEKVYERKTKRKVKR